MSAFFRSEQSLVSGLVLLVALRASPSVAAPTTLRIEGALTIHNHASVDSVRDAVLRVFGDEVGFLGESPLGPEVWPPPGQSHSTPITLDVVVPGPGVIDQHPLRLDDDALEFFRRVPAESRAPLAAGAGRAALLLVGGAGRRRTVA